MSKASLAILFATASTAALAFVQPASAQAPDQPAATAGTGLEEVIVTARRREEKAQTVPIAFTDRKSVV